MLQIASDFVYYLPSVLLTWLYPPSKVERKVTIDFRPSDPIRVATTAALDSTRPQNIWLELYLRIQNDSHIDVTLDRVVVEFCVGQPLVLGAVLHRNKIKPHKSQDVFFKTPLTWAQQLQITDYREDANRCEQMQLTADAYLDSKVGPVHVRTSPPLEREKKYLVQ